MATYDKDPRAKTPNVATGLAVTLAVHAGLIGGAVALHHEAPREPEAKLVNLIEAKLVKLGTPLPEKALPRLEAAAPPPPPDPGVQVTPDEKVDPTPAPKKEPPKRRDKEEDDLELKMRLAAASRAAGQSQSGSRTSTHTGAGGPAAGGDPRGDPEGEALSARDQIQGNLWAAEVRKALHRAWDIPQVIPDADLRRLAATVVIQIDESGNIKKWALRTKASGGAFASLFNNSVDSVRSKVSQLPTPPAGAFKMFKNGNLALRFTKAEADKVQ